MKYVCVEACVVMRLTLTLAAASGSSVALSVATARMSARLPMGPVDGLLWYSWTQEQEEEEARCGEARVRWI